MPMPTGLFFRALLGILPGLALADTAAPPIPDTPAGHALASWLDAFDSGDGAKFESFAKAHAPWMNIEREMQTRARNGGYDLVSIDASGKLWIVFHAKERVSNTRIFGNLVVRLGLRRRRRGSNRLDPIRRFASAMPTVRTSRRCPVRRRRSWRRTARRCVRSGEQR